MLCCDCFYVCLCVYVSGIRLENPAPLAKPLWDVVLERNCCNNIAAVTTTTTTKKTPRWNKKKQHTHTQKEEMFFCQPNNIVVCVCDGYK